MTSFPLKVPAIKVEQPLGEFYMVALSAECLLQLCYTVNAELLQDDDDRVSHLGSIVNKITGSQRVRKNKRLEEIKNYTETVDASFPNSIILGANYDENGNLISSIEERWSVEEFNDSFYFLNIPTARKLASIIDGQHRVFAFTNSKSQEMMLACAVYIDLPLPYHARIFTNINMNQKRVDKNLAYNLFHFDMKLGEPATWSPETLAVYFARVLAEDNKSPLKGMLRLGLANTFSNSSISMASVIDGVLSLISSNPKHDRELMHTKAIEDGRSRSMLEITPNSPPLRYLYISNQDKKLFDLILSYLHVVVEVLWCHDVFKKTLAIHACFDYFKVLCASFPEVVNSDPEYFKDLLNKTNLVDFSNEFFGVQSKLRLRLRNTLLSVTGITNINNLVSNEDELKNYYSILP